MFLRGGESVWEVGPTRVLGDVLVDGFRLELVGSCFDLVESVIETPYPSGLLGRRFVMTSGSCFVGDGVSDGRAGPNPGGVAAPVEIFGGLLCGHVCILSSPSGVRIQIPRYLCPCRWFGFGGESRYTVYLDFFCGMRCTLGVNDPLLVKSVNVNFKQSVWMS